LCNLDKLSKNAFLVLTLWLHCGTIKAYNLRRGARRVALPAEAIPQPIRTAGNPFSYLRRGKGAQGARRRRDTQFRRRLIAFIFISKGELKK
jgi:hypothetical protein